MFFKFALPDITHKSVSIEHTNSKKKEVTIDKAENYTILLWLILLYYTLSWWYYAPVIFHITKVSLFTNLKCRTDIDPTNTLLLMGKTHSRITQELNTERANKRIKELHEKQTYNQTAQKYTKGPLKNTPKSKTTQIFYTRLL